MNAHTGPAAPESGIDNDPEILALLDFEPVPRKRVVDGAWTPELQREFIARLAVTGSPGRACDEMGKNETGIMKLYRSPQGASFRAAWDAAVELAADRKLAGTLLTAPVTAGSRPPSLDNRRKWRGAQRHERLPGQVLNEYGEWEDEQSVHGRGQEARDRISAKLLSARRMFLGEISESAAKRAAFEILTELPIDWEKAGRLEPQDDEPWRNPNLRTPEMILTAENGWMGDMVHGPDKKAELLAEINAWRAEQGLDAVEEDGDG